MEELMIKYAFGECTSEEKKQVELLFEKDDALKQEFATMLSIDKMATEQFKPMALDNAYQQKLTAMLTKEVQSIAKPHLIPELNLSIDLTKQERSIFLDNIGPILFAVVSLTFVAIYGGKLNTSQHEVSAILSGYSSFILLGSLCLLGLFFMDQMLGKKQGSRNFMMSL
jgi:hypothetical protein